MVLTESAAVADLTRRLTDLFYRRQGLPCGVYVCTPAAGSRVIAVEA
jgi:N-acetylgalactosamine kinase